MGILSNNSLSRGTNMALLALFLAFFSATASVASTDDKYATCINYWVVGDSGCNAAKPVSKTTVPKALPPPIIETAQSAPEAPKQKTLNERIDGFMKNHGKPPREFVAFHLEPTLENALKWVRKYNDMTSRSIELTNAWMQAEKIYEAVEAKGENMAVLDEGDLGNIPDYGIDIPNLPRQNMSENQAGFPNSIGGFEEGQFGQAGLKGVSEWDVPGLDLSGLTPENVQSGVFAGEVSNQLKLSESGHIGGNPDAIKIDYYFSAECPYCTKFEPEFQQVIQEMQGKLSVTCVDMTPSARTSSNIYGKVDCAWRPVAPGEITQKGIRMTPTLVINRGAGKPKERISGYVEGEKLKNYLLTGPK